VQLPDLVGIAALAASLLPIAGRRRNPEPVNQTPVNQTPVNQTPPADPEEGEPDAS
jgi:hypothetical protein